MDKVITSTSPGNQCIVREYYAARVKHKEQVNKLRQGNHKAHHDDLHALTGYDYLSQQQWHAMVKRIFIDEIKLSTQTPRILEVGCGSGAFLNSLALHYPRAELYGFDMTPELIQVALKRSGIPACNLWVGNALDPTSYQAIEPNSMDVVYCMGVSIHLGTEENADKVFSTMYSLVKPGGVVFVGYNLDGKIAKHVEKSRTTSKRRTEMVETLGIRDVPDYLYLDHAFYSSLAAKLGAQYRTMMMSDQFTEPQMLKLFPELPSSFRGRCSVLLIKPQTGKSTTSRL